MIPLVAPRITSIDREVMAHKLHTGLLADLEHEVTAFEREFAAFVGTQAAVAVNSGTTALTLALRALNLQGLELDIPTYTCRQVLTAALNADITPRLVDLQYDIEAATFTTVHAADIQTHLFGTAGKEGLVNDVTLSLGGTPRVFDHVVCSTHSDKMISTGRGGVVAGNRNFVQRARDLAVRDSLLMTGMQAALGRTQLRQLPGFIRYRQSVAANYTREFNAAGIECPGPTCSSVYFRYIIGVPDAAEAVRELADRGIEAGRGVHPPLHYLYGTTDTFPGADHAHQHLLSVPCHPALTDSEVEYIARHVQEVCA